MKLDFDQLKRLKDSFHAQFTADGALYQQIDKGSMVYSINFTPGEGQAKVHMQWPYFRNLVANEAEHPATYSVVQQTPEEEPWIHWSCDVQGVEISACMFKADVLKEFSALELPEGCILCEEDHIESLLVLWMNMTGWNGGAV